MAEMGYCFACRWPFYRARRRYSRRRACPGAKRWLWPVRSYALRRRVWAVPSTLDPAVDPSLERTCDSIRVRSRVRVSRVGLQSAATRLLRPERSAPGRSLNRKRVSFLVLRVGACDEPQCSRTCRREGMRGFGETRVQLRHSTRVLVVAVDSVARTRRSDVKKKPRGRLHNAHSRRKPYHDRSSVRRTGLGSGRRSFGDCKAEWSLRRGRKKRNLLKRVTSSESASPRWPAAVDMVAPRRSFPSSSGCCPCSATSGPLARAELKRRMMLGRESEIVQRLRRRWRVSGRRGAVRKSVARDSPVGESPSPAW